jgi:hypothetical protein
LGICVKVEFIHSLTWSNDWFYIACNLTV